MRIATRVWFRGEFVGCRASRPVHLSRGFALLQIPGPLAETALSDEDVKISEARLDDLAADVQVSFRLQADVLDGLKAACMANRDIASFGVLGLTDAERPLTLVTLGSGPTVVSLVAGSHADEPVGPETLRLFILRVLRERQRLDSLLERFTFLVFQHVNPDGESRNRPWIREWPNPAAYLRHAVREEPGQDLEFGYPDLRRENELVARALAQHAPIALHVSLHGMGFAEGGMLLIDPNWGYRTVELQNGYRVVLDEVGLGLHDHNRRGEKGFFYLGPGFSTTPSGTAMRSWFEAQGDVATAALFRSSSMEYVRSLGGDPLSLVTEVPLFALTPSPKREPGVPATYLEWREALPSIRRKVARGRSVDNELAAFFVEPVALHDAIRIQLRAIGLGLQAVSSS